MCISAPQLPILTILGTCPRSAMVATDIVTQQSRGALFLGRALEKVLVFGLQSVRIIGFNSQIQFIESKYFIMTN
jgi:hypothetical protein